MDEEFGIIDLVPHRSSGCPPMADRAYEGTMGKGYARYMDSPALQRMDGWLLGMRVPRYYEAVLSRFERLPSGPSLDIPSGGGPLMRHASIYREGGPWLFADLSWTMLRHLRTKCLHAGVKDVALIRADACDLPFGDGLLRNIVSLFGLHCFHDKSAVFSQWRRCLAPGGQAVVTTLTDDGPLLSRLYVEWLRGDGTFAPGSSLGQIREQAANQGLTIEDVNRLGAAVLFEARHG